MRTTILVTCALAACVGAPRSHPLPRNDATGHREVVAVAGCELPPEWNVGEILAGAVVTERPETMHPRLLAWHEIEDDRPLRIDEALVLYEMAGGYGLTHVYRHPVDDRDRHWHEYMVYDAGSFEGHHGYDHRPTPAELDAFLAATWWRFTPEQDYRLLGSGVWADAWIAAFGKAPWHAYPR